MKKFNFLSRKTLLNYASGWNFILSIYKYPVVVYINLHNINNSNLHEIKNYMSNINGLAQVLNTHQLSYLFSTNIKFKFMVTGNIVALMFQKWEDVWKFNYQQKQLNLLISTISIKGVFLNLCTDICPLEHLENLFKQNKNVMVKTTSQLICSNHDIYSCLVLPITTTSNSISLVLYQLIQVIENLSININNIKTY